MTASSKMKDIIDTVNAPRRRKKGNSEDVMVEYCIATKHTSLQAFQVFAGNEKYGRESDLNKSNYSIAKKVSLSKGKEWLKQKLHQDAGCEIIEKSYRRVPCDDVDRKSTLDNRGRDASMSPTNDILNLNRLHRTIEINNNCKYEIDNQPTFESFVSNVNVSSAKESADNKEDVVITSSLRIPPSWKNKQQKTNMAFTSETLFDCSPVWEEENNARNNIFDRLLQNRLGSLPTLNDSAEKRNNSLSVNLGIDDHGCFSELIKNQNNLHSSKGKGSSLPSSPKFKGTFHHPKSPNIKRRSSQSPKVNRHSSHSLESKRDSSQSPKVKRELPTVPQVEIDSSTESADSTDCATTSERKLSSGSEKSEIKPRSYSESFSDAIQNSWRRIAAGPRRNSAPKKTLPPPNCTSIHFGSCISPDIKKFAGLTDKLHTWAHRSNINKRFVHRRNFSLTAETFTDPEKNTRQGITTQNLQSTLKKRQKSYEQRQKSYEQQKDSSCSDDSTAKKNTNFVSYNISLERELVHEYFLDGLDFTITPNTWYYGELDISCNGCTENDAGSESAASSSDDDETVRGSLLVLVDGCKDIHYSLTYCIGNRLHIGTIPYECGKYCMDFTNPQQPRFYNIRFLFAHLIEQNYLYRVPFTWLLESFHCSNQSVESEDTWESDESEVL